VSGDSSHKRFGVSVELPKNDPMRAPHLLGDDWSSERWFSTEEQRDAAMQAMLTQPEYYRKGDSPSVTLKKVERG